MSKGLAKQEVISSQSLDTTFLLLSSIWFSFLLYDLIIIGKREAAFQYFYKKYLKEDHEQHKVLLNPFIRLYKRLFDYSNQIKNRSQLALIVGLILGITPIIALPYANNDKLDVYVLINRGLFVLTIESIAFYFFNLYRSSLDSIKYYQNELSNIDLKMVSVLNAIENKDDKLLKKIANKFIDEERHILNDLHKNPVDISAFDQLNKMLDRIALISKNPK